jgi:hypothetical protein
LEDRKQVVLDDILAMYTQIWVRLGILKDEVGRDEGQGGREVALAKTKFEEGALWLGEVQRIFNRNK